MLHLNARVVAQPICLSSFQLRDPEPHQQARRQQYVHPQRVQTHQLRRKQRHERCTCEAQSLVDALGGQPAPQRAWWNDHQELWAIVHSPEELDQQLQGDGKDLVVVDFYGTWCAGCAKVYPEVCRVAADPNLRQRCHFVKVCVDSMKERMKADGVRSLPYLAFYNPSGGKLAGYVNLPSRSRLLRANIEKLLQNNGAKFALDPNGFVVVTESAESRTLNTEEEMEVNLQDMQKEREEIFASSNVPVFSTMLNWVQKVTMSGLLADLGSIAGCCFSTTASLDSSWAAFAPI